MTAPRPPADWRLTWPGKGRSGWENLLGHEWLVTNGLGGYASGTVAGVPTRRFHGLLVAALPAPLGRIMMFNDLVEEVRAADGSWVPLGGEEPDQPELRLRGAELLREFRLERNLPVWTYQLGSSLLEKRLVMPNRQNTVAVTYRLLGSGPLRLRLRPALHFRRHEDRLGHLSPSDYVLSVTGNRYEIAASRELPPLRFVVRGCPGLFVCEARTIPDVHYRLEEVRGYEARGDLWSPGAFEAGLEEGERVSLVASTERWETLEAIPPTEALAIEGSRLTFVLEGAGRAVSDDVAAQLVLASDAFLVVPTGRVQDLARARAAGASVRTVIAGYHWFTDWGRDTMISLEGLTLVTGRHLEAGWILRTFADYVRDGLIPNLFPEGDNQGLYHTADATLWFFHAIDRYLQATGHRALLRALLPRLLDIVGHHLRGTRFGIGVDPDDGLLRQGQEGYQLTWMDAKVEGWVVTPRRGKAVEINALWYNALKLLEGWVAEEHSAAEAAGLAEHAERARRSFNRRFWYEAGGHLYDVVDGEQGDDPACRPNQLLAISLPHPVLDRSRWEPVVHVAEQRLLTPVGLRSLAPGHPDYKPRYYGDLRARDAAYHQGTVWAWLIGPFVDAWLKVHPERPAAARRFVEGFVPHLSEAGIGSISEVFDAEEPFTPRGCMAQAWSVAEVLRIWVKTAGD